MHIYIHIPKLERVNHHVPCENGHFGVYRILSDTRWLKIFARRPGMKKRRTVRRMINPGGTLTWIEMHECFIF